MSAPNTSSWLDRDALRITGVRAIVTAPEGIPPIGAAANVALDVTSYAFGIQEAHNFADAALEVFPGTLTAVAGPRRFRVRRAGAGRRAARPLSRMVPCEPIG